MISLKKISIIALGLVIGGVIGMVLTFLTVNNSDSASEEKLINNDEFTNIVVRADNAQINLYPTDEVTPKVELSGNNSNYVLSADEKDTTLSVRVENRQNKLFHFQFFSPTLSVNVFVPEKVYETIRIESNNGRINAEELQVYEVNIETDNGRIELKHVLGEIVTTEADNGSIELTNVQASTIAAKTKNGAISFKEVEGNIVGKTNNGRISLLTKQIDSSIDLATDNGRIQIQTEQEPTNATILVNTANGSVDVFGSSSRNVVIGEGDNMIQLTTANGGIKVERK
ncbi:DUF4097 family beta strand repeat-containing protein [Halalkalibacter flavus]|uniref:DUF4097 family beta strand repeat-containing protein n=1 Tax=Halalkalibacter flavus TaxID=3090668 RepID=UPI002FC9A196